MTLESFRRALRVRHREAAACARARLLDEARDESQLDELDADLFSRDALDAAVSEWLASADGGASTAGASARSRLAIVLEDGLLARLRPLDGAIERALGRERREEVEDLAEERGRLLVQEGARAIAASASVSGEPVLARTLAAETRGERAETLATSAQRLLAESTEIAEQAEGLARSSSRVRDSGAPPLFAQSFAKRATWILEGWCGPGPDLPETLVGPALRELGSDLGLDRVPGLAIGAAGAAGASRVVEIDPPEDVLLVLPAGAGFDAFMADLEAWGESLAPCARSRALPDEHRLHADRAMGFALGALAVSLAPEHAHLRREPVPARRRALAREIASARLAAALFLHRDRQLSGLGSGRDGARAAIEEASLGRSHPSAADPPREPVFEAMDRFRGHLLAPHLKERLRTRFGNLWYRERGAGRLLREACEPGGSLLTAEILAGLSLPVPCAESLVDSWRDEIKRLR